MVDTIVLGLDGATWEVLDPLIEEGRVPNIANVVDEDYSGTLESTYPPVTAPAWLSMATGKNPGQTGIYYYLNRKSSDSFEFETFGSEKYQGESVWDILSTKDMSVGVLNYPMLYPPYEIDGYMVSGLASPDDDSITYPAELKSELDDVTGGYEIEVPYADPKYAEKPDELLADLIEIVEKREAAIEYLLENRETDVFFGVLSATDWAQHYFWKYWDEDHAYSEAAARDAYGDNLPRVWERVDETVGKVADIAEENGANLVIISDHGFGKVERTFFVNEWLEREGFRVTQGDSISSYRARLFPYLRHIGERVVSAVPQLNDIAKQVGKQIQGTPEDSIDWEESVAYAPRHNVTCGMVHLLAEPEETETRLRTALDDAAEEYGMGVNVYSREELYSGENVELAPELLFEIDDFECAVDPRHTTSGKIMEEGPPHPARNGGHKRDGIYIFAGDQTHAGEGEKASLLDIAPTLLFMLEKPIPDAMDGEVRTDAFEARFRDEKEINIVDDDSLYPTGQKTSRNDQKEVEERLGDLGYI